MVESVSSELPFELLLADEASAAEGGSVESLMGSGTGRGGGFGGGVIVLGQGSLYRIRARTASTRKRRISGCV